MNSLPRKAIVIQEPELCHYCRSHFGSDVTVMKIERNLSYGWRLDGKGAMHIECNCPVCGMMYTTVEKMIPIECDSYLCPSCNEASNLEYKVCKIERDNHEFTFNAEIFCKKCHKKNHLTQALKRILNIKKIEIKLTGITIERFGE